jgi:lipoate-protein ligase A
MNKKIGLFLGPNNCPYHNLAIEDWFLRHSDYDYVLYLWQSEPSIVMGRFQNPWIECKLQAIKDEGVNLVRRQSGGGTVYHDLGNLNYTFIAKKADYNVDLHFDIVIKGLDKLGVNAYVSPRNDILLDHEGQTYKISGSAFKQTKDASFHHGTILFAADLNRLNDFLNPKKRQIEAKGIKSVRSQVINISQLNSERPIDFNQIVSSFSSSFNTLFGTELIALVVNDEFVDLDHVNDYQKAISDWSWVFGETPKFTQTIPWHHHEIIVHAKKGLITSIESTSVDLSNVSGLYENKALTREALETVALAHESDQNAREIEQLLIKHFC